MIRKQKPMKKAQNINLSTVQAIEELSLDLQSGSKDPKLVRLGHLDVDRRRWPLVDWILSSLPKGVFRLELEVRPDPNLVIRPGHSLLQLVIDGQAGTQIDQLTVRSHRTDYSVLFYPDAIEDCRIVQTDARDLDSFSVAYMLKLYGKNDDEPWDTLESTFRLTFVRFTAPQPEFVFVPDPETVTFARQKIRVGELRVSHSSRFFRAPAVDVRFHIHEASLGGKPVAVSLAARKDARVVAGRSRLNPYLPAGVGGGGNYTDDDACDFYGLIGNQGEITGLCVNMGRDVSGNPCSHYFGIPVSLHLESPGLQNPFDDQEIELKVTSSVRLHSQDVHDNDLAYGPERSVDVGTVHLLKDKSIRGVDVAVGSGYDPSRDDQHLLKDGNARFERRISGRNMGGEHDKLRYHLSLANTRQSPDTLHPGAGIHFKGIKFGPFETENGVSIDFKDGKSLQNGLFTVKNPVRSRVLPDGDRPLVFKIDYTDGHIGMITGPNGDEVFEAWVDLPVSFNYYRDDTGDYADVEPSNWTFYSVTLRFKIFKRPSPEWLCVDFGTSAIVAAYSDDPDEEGHLVRLAEYKRNLLQQVYQGDLNAQRDRDEGSEFLISSATVLQNDQLQASLQATPVGYATSSVTLSPPSIGYPEYYNQLLPCLKSIVGNRQLPEELLPQHLRNRNAKVKVDDIIELVYKQFFHYFLPDEPKRTNSLVMSFPNTFTPLQVDKVRRMALGRTWLPQLRSDCLLFISESDAIAFYYNHHREDFIRAAGNLLRGREETFDTDVLVYDMGAGTLDITYFTRTRLADGKTHIDIKGKMGVNKAGNYLDYLLACILVDRLCEQESVKANQLLVNTLRDLVSLTPGPNWSMHEASLLKEYVRDVLKLHLDDAPDSPLPSQLTIPGSPIPLQLTISGSPLPVAEVTVGQIVTDERFQRYLSEVSEEIFRHFVSPFGSGEGSLPLTMLVFSGRTTGLLHLRKAVRRHLRILSYTPPKSWSDLERNCLFADLSTKKFILDFDRKVTDVVGLKTAVVDGAMAYCLGSGAFDLDDTPKLFATYGLLFKAHTGEETWLPLFDFHTERADSAVIGDEDVQIIYDSSVHRVRTNCPIDPDQVQLQLFSSILVVQSYSSRTLEDWQEGKTELISVLGGFRPDPNAPGSVPVKLTVNRDGLLELSINGAIQELSPHDDYSSTSFAMALWPIVKF